MKEEKSFFGQYKEQIDEALEDLKTKGRRHKQIPNLLTLLRLTAPLIIIPAAVIGSIPFIVGATAAFGLTDLADGFIARHWNLQSKLGADLDALADKIFAGTLLLAASVSNPALLVNVAMEMAIAGINISEKAKGNEPKSTIIGKIKTWSLFGLAGTAVLSNVFSPAIISTLALTTTSLQALTIKSYLKKYNRGNKLPEKVEEELGKSNIEDIKEETKELTQEKVIEKANSNNEHQTDRRIEELQELKGALLSAKTTIAEAHPKTEEIQEQPKLLQKK